MKTSIIIKENQESEFNGYLTTELKTDINFDYLNIIIKKLIKEEEEKRCIRTKKVKIDCRNEYDNTFIFSMIMEVPLGCNKDDIIKSIKENF